MLRQKLKLSNPQNHYDSEDEIEHYKPKLRRSDIEPKLASISDSSTRKSQRSDISIYFSNTSYSVSDKMFELQKELNEDLSNISFLKTPISYVYNPTVYAEDAYKNYLNKYCTTTKKIIFLGINPGPWGMCQTGVPFGEVKSVQNWLQIGGYIGQPEHVCIKRQIEGFDCERIEISGKRFWSFFMNLCGTADVFFKDAFVYNYCPLAFMKEDGVNVTPADMKSNLAKERKSLEGACDKTLVEVIKLIQPEFIIGIGRYAETKATYALKSTSLDVKVVYLPHPSPRSGKSKNWPEEAEKVLEVCKLKTYFQ